MIASPEEHSNPLPNVIDGKPFRCGCSVFHHPRDDDFEPMPDVFQCNGCDNRYEGK